MENIISTMIFISVTCYLGHNQMFPMYSFYNFLMHTKSTTNIVTEQMRYKATDGNICSNESMTEVSSVSHRNGSTQMDS